MKFQIAFEILPAGPFGVPQDNVTVVPGKIDAQYYGDTYHTATMIRVGYGSLPQYRSDEEAIDISLTVGNSQVHIRDNFIFATSEAANWREAYGQATGEINLFLQHLSLSHGGAFTFRPLIPRCISP